VIGGVVGGVVLPAVPDDVEPGAGEDAYGVGVVLAAGDGSVVEVGGPGVGVAGVVGEVADCVTEVLVARPAKPDQGQLAGLPCRGRDAGQTRQRFWGGEPGAAVPDFCQKPRGADGRAATYSAAAPNKASNLWSPTNGGSAATSSIAATSTSLVPLISS